MGAQRLEFIGCGHKRQLGEIRHLFGKFLGEAGLCIEAGADGSPPLRQFINGRQGLLNAAYSVIDHCRVAGKFLAQGDRSCILRVGAADLDDIGPFLRLVVQRIAQFLQGRDKGVHGLLAGGDMHGRWKGVIGGLRLVYMIVRMNRIF